MRLDWQKFLASKEQAQVSDAKPIMKNTDIGSSIPVSPPVVQKKTDSTSSVSRKSDLAGDDFELVEHDDEFEILDNEGQSAANGIKDQNAVVDGLDGGFRMDWEDDE